MTLAEILAAAPGMPLAQLLDEVARWRIRGALRAANGNQTAASTALGLKQRQRLRDWIVRLGLAEEAAAYDRSDRQPAR